MKITSGTARSSSHQLKVLYFLLKRDLAKSPVISSRPRPFPVVMADHTIIPGKQLVPTDMLHHSTITNSAASENYLPTPILWYNSGM